MKKKEDESLSETKRMLHFLMHPVEFRLKDVMQIVIGSAILAVPVGFTEETWRLGETLPFLNVFGLIAISILFISLFTYYHYYKNHMREHWDEFAKRVISTYLVAMIVVAVILALIQRTPWTIDFTLAFKRIVIVAFPASMSAAVADTIK